jgi:hypothetical protein
VAFLDLGSKRSRKGEGVALSCLEFERLFPGLLPLEKGERGLEPAWSMGGSQWRKFQSMMYCSPKSLCSLMQSGSKESLKAWSYIMVGRRIVLPIWRVSDWRLDFNLIIIWSFSPLT